MNFNTSHVTVYQLTKLWPGKSVSNFNTSHVTVYRICKSFCFYGSGISIHLMLLFICHYLYRGNRAIKFQYISCYCLSFSVAIYTADLRISIHLMLLFITVRSLRIFSHSYFNTSHVTVYLVQFVPNITPFTISIHLMLLFISLSLCA